MARKVQLSNSQAESEVVSSSPVGRKTSITVRSVAEHAQDTFGNPEKAAHWMNRPNPLLGGKKPAEVIQVNPVSVEAELVRIDHGVYA